MAHPAKIFTNRTTRLTVKKYNLLDIILKTPSGYVGSTTQTLVRWHNFNLILELSNDNISTDKSGYGTQTGKGVGFATR